MTGRPPFRAATALETLAQVKDTDPVSPSRFQPGLPGDIQTICLKCLEKSPARRYATAENLAEDLRRFLDGEPILAHPASTWSRAWKWARRRPALAAALSVSAGAVVLLLVGALYYNTQLQASVREARAAEGRALDAGNRTLKNLNQLVFDVQEKLGKTAATREVRKELLDTALEGLDEIALRTAAAPPDLERAVAHQKLGDIFREIGRTDEAATQYHHARACGGACRQRASRPADCGLPEPHLCRARRAELECRSHRRRRWLSAPGCRPRGCHRGDQPGPARARHARLEAYFRLGRAYSFGRDLKVADVWFRKMHDLAERWSEMEPANTLARDLLSTSHRKLADVRKIAGEYAAARVEYLKAIALGDELVAVEPANREIKQHLALALDDLALTLRRMGRLAEAGIPSRRAEQLFGELVKSDPDDIDNQVRVVQTQFNFGCLEMDGLDMAAAETRLTRSLEGLLRLDRDGKLEGRPRDKDQLLKPFQNELAACRAVAASPGDLNFLKHRGHFDACRLLRIRVGVLSAAGRAGELAETAESLLGMDADQAEDLYELGRSLACCAGHLERSAQPTIGPTPECQARRVRFADRAVAVLTRAVASGLRDPSRLGDDAMLAPIREHPGFHRLTERLGSSGLPR